MINTEQYRNAYNDFYVELRRFFWSMDTVVELADLEVECYKTFPDPHKVRSIFEQLYRSIKSTADEDEDLKDAAQKFRSAIEIGSESTYSNIKNVNEVILNEN